MEIELNKRKIDFYDIVYETGTIHEECAESIVPDSSPDMARIISASGHVCVKEKNLHEGSVAINGNVNGNVLYMAEGEDSIRKVEVKIPFLHEFESAAIGNDTKCVVNVKLISLEAREINTRKIALRAQIAMEIKCYSIKCIETTCDIVEKEKAAIETQKKNVDFYVPVFIRERSFSIVDDIEIPSSAPSFASMLENNVEVLSSDMKIIGTKAIVKGVAKIRYTYNTKDGMISVATHELPYSQIMDIDECGDDCDLSINMTMRALEIEPVHDMTGDTRYISVNILMDTTLVAYLKDTVELIDDLYSVTHTLDYKFEEITACTIKDRTSRRITLNETIETANSVKRVLDTRIVLEPIRIKQNKIENDAQVQVMYIGDDDCLYCVCRRCAVECMTALSETAKLICDVEITGENSTGVGNQLSVRCFVDYDIRMMEKENIRNLKAINICSERVKENDDACVIIKHVYSEQPLWNLAKKYNTTMDEIAAANGLEFSETIEAGSMLLIPCGK